MWCLKGLLAFSGVLPTEGVGSLGTKVWLDYVWKPGDSKGWDRSWDCSERSQPDRWLFRHPGPWLLPHSEVHMQLTAGDTCLSQCCCRDAVPQQWLMSTYLNSCHRQISDNAAVFANDMVGDLTDTASRTGDRPTTSVWNTKCVYALLCEVWHKMWDWTCIWQVQWVSRNTMPLLLHTVRLSPIAFGIWK